MFELIEGLKFSGTFSIVFGQKDSFSGAGFLAFQSLSGVSSLEVAQAWLKEHGFKSMQTDEHQGRTTWKFNENTWLKGESWDNGGVAMIIPEIEVANIALSQYEETTTIRKVTILERTDGKSWSGKDMVNLGATLMTLAMAPFVRPTFLLLLEDFSLEIVAEVVGHTNFKATAVDLIDENFAPLQFNPAGCEKVIQRYLANLR